jgi:hypothetical protein
MQPSAVVTIPADAASTLLPINPLDDTAIEATETVSVTLTKNAAFTLATRRRARVFIVSDELPTVSIVASDAEATEAGPTMATFSVFRNGSTLTALTVVYRVGHGHGGRRLHRLQKTRDHTDWRLRGFYRGDAGR